jgi:hypothetical protein
MDRAGQQASPLTADESKVIFATLKSGQGQEKARQRLPKRDRATVNRAYNVVAEFERRGITTLDDRTAKEIADGAKYSATVSYVQDLFLRWRTWHSAAGALRLGAASVRLFTDNLWVARYAVVEVRCVSKVEAEGCWGRATVLGPKSLMVPLHWAGTPYGPQEHEAPLTRITPGMPARLDVAFALPPPGQERAGIERAATSGQISMSVTSFYPQKEESSWAIPSRQRQEPQRPRLSGCWLAQPLALFNPRPGVRSYLVPGRYTIRVEVGCTQGEGDRSEFELVSPESWEGLQLHLLR